MAAAAEFPGQNGIHAYVVGASLRRTVAGKPSEVLQTRLASTSIFSYSPDTTATETVGLLLEVIPPASPDATIQLTSEIHLRNLEGDL